MVAIFRYGTLALIRKMYASLSRLRGSAPLPKCYRSGLEKPIGQRMREWIELKRSKSARPPRRYENLEDAYKRMKEANAYLSDEQARHLTIHGISQNEDGTWSWKFDSYYGTPPPYDLVQEDVETLWSQITCPTLLLYGEDSWASNPAEDGRLAHFNTATVKLYKDAGHWLHHDQFDQFVADLKSFL